ncbi:YadA-like family protein [Klebsiella aerogenes]|uniref:YadA-like family protein n=1 Tax=Klebsiella aerogenes TaxID=548 RepID=UPI00069B5143|nr:YadA-like family protein [Klebsiella aerogenes]
MLNKHKLTYILVVYSSLSFASSPYKSDAISMSSNNDKDPVATDYNGKTGVDGAWQGVAVGPTSQAFMGSTTIGDSAKSEGQFGVSLGTKATVTNQAKNSVALGAHSISNQENQVSIGNDTLKRQLTNLADGKLAEGSSDAVTGNQLHATSKSVAQNAAAITDTRAAADKGIADNKTAIADTRAAADKGIADNKAAIAGLDAGAVKYDRKDGKVDLSRATLAGQDGSTLTNLKDGLVAEGSSDAVTGNQLHATSKSVAQNAAAITDTRAAADKGIADNKTAIADTRAAADKGIADNKAAIADNIAHSSNMLKTEEKARRDGDKQTLEQANKHTSERERVINNRTDEEIQNESEARKIGDIQTLQSANRYTDYKVESQNQESLQQSMNYTDKRFQQSKNYTDNKFKQLTGKINRAEKRLNAGIAGVTAIASIPYLTENNFSYGVGIGNYQNGNALAAGVQYRISQNNNVRLNISWDSSSNSAIGVGFSGGW